MSETEQLLPPIEILDGTADDFYHEAIMKLCQNPDLIEYLIQFPDADPAGCVFYNAAERLYSLTKLSNGKFLGNPPMIKIYPDFYSAQDDRITKKILEDDRLPSRLSEYSLVHLPVIANYQRYFDKHFDRHYRKMEVLDGESEGIVGQDAPEGVHQEDSSPECTSQETDSDGGEPAGSEAVSNHAD